VLVCHGLFCTARGSRQLYGELQARLAGRPDVGVEPWYCFNGCSHGPNVVFQGDRVWYEGVAADDLDGIVSHAATGSPVVRTRPSRLPDIVKTVAFEALDRKYPPGA
jgi:(2Fe-2S) ferredoxin